MNEQVQVEIHFIQLTLYGKPLLRIVFVYPKILETIILTNQS